MSSETVSVYSNSSLDDLDTTFLYAADGEPAPYVESIVGSLADWKRRLEFGGWGQKQCDRSRLSLGTCHLRFVRVSVEKKIMTGRNTVMSIWEDHCFDRDSEKYKRIRQMQATPISFPPSVSARNLAT